MAKTTFYTVRQPGLSRISVQDGNDWRAFCYYDFRSYTLTESGLALHHNEFLILLQGINLRQLYLSLVVEEVFEIPVHPGIDLPDNECAVTQIIIQRIQTHDD